MQILPSSGEFLKSRPPRVSVLREEHAKRTSVQILLSTAQATVELQIAKELCVDAKDPLGQE